MALRQLKKSMFIFSRKKVFRPALKQILFLATLLNYLLLLNSDVKKKPFVCFGGHMLALPINSQPAA